MNKRWLFVLKKRITISIDLFYKNEGGIFMKKQEIIILNSGIDTDLDSSEGKREYSNCCYLSFIPFR